MQVLRGFESLALRQFHWTISSVGQSVWFTPRMSLVRTRHRLPLRILAEDFRQEALVRMPDCDADRRHNGIRIRPWTDQALECDRSGNAGTQSPAGDCGK